jgi:broad specificity phosphatase PhoE
MGVPTTVYLVRHGATAANREVPYRLLGRTLDLSLDDEGRDQARRAAAILESLPITAVYCSPLLRAHETANAIASKHDLVPIPLADLIEADLGRWEGLTWDAARNADPEHYDAFHAHPGTVPYPGGESFLDAQHRLTGVIEALVSKHRGEHIAIVSHNVTNRAYLAGLLGIPIDLARSIRQANGGINVIHYEGAKVTVEMLNSCFHLDSPVESPLADRIRVEAPVMERLQ